MRLRVCSVAKDGHKFASTDLLVRGRPAKDQHKTARLFLPTWQQSEQLKLPGKYRSQVLVVSLRRTSQAHLTQYRWFGIVLGRGQADGTDSKSSVVLEHVFSRMVTSSQTNRFVDAFCRDSLPWTQFLPMKNFPEVDLLCADHFLKRKDQQSERIG